MFKFLITVWQSESATSQNVFVGLKSIILTLFGKLIGHFIDIILPQ